MKQGRRWLVRHAGIAVGSAGRNTFEQAQYASDAIYLVQSSNEMHLRRARICEANVNSTGGESASEAFSSIHRRRVSHTSGANVRFLECCCHDHLLRRAFERRNLRPQSPIGQAETAPTPLDCMMSGVQVIFTQDTGAPSMDLQSPDDAPSVRRWCH